MTKWLWYLAGLCYRTFRPFPLRMIDPADVKSLLIVRPDYLGDTLLFLPKLREIRRALPDAIIDFAASCGVRELIERTGWVDNVIEMDAREVEAFPPRHLRATIRRLRGRSYDLVMATSLAGFNTGLLLAATRTQYLMGYAPGYNRFVFTKIFPFDSDRPIYQQDWDFVEWLGGKIDTKLVSYPTMREEALHVERWLAKNSVGSERYAIFHHSKAVPQCRWSTVHWLELAQKLRADSGIPVILTGTGQPVVSTMKDGVEGVLDMTGTLTLGQLEVLIEKACLVVSLDTGPLHMAVATGVPTVGLYATQRLRNRWGYGPEFRHVADVVAASCDNDGMKISVETVLQSIRTVLPQQ